MSETTLASNGQLQETDNKKGQWTHILLLLFVTVMSYGLLINRLGFIWDDIGVFFSRYFYGEASLRVYTSVDRAFDFIFFAVIPRLLGYSALRWHLFGILVWWLNGTFFYLFLKRLIPSKTHFAAWASLLFIVFPTFSTMYDGVIYPVMFLSLMWLLLSLLFMESYFRDPKRRNRFLLLSLFFCLIEILHTEYWIGIELGRFLLIMILVSRETSLKKLLRKDVIIISIKKYIPYLLVITGFIVYRLFFYKSLRPDTDQHEIVRNMLKHPVKEIATRGLFLFTDVIITTFFSWVQCFGRYLYDTNDPKVVFEWFALIATVVAVLFIYYRRKAKADGNGDAEAVVELSDRKLAMNLLIIGLIFIILGQLPMSFAHNHARQDSVASRFGLPAIFGSSMVVASVLILISRTRKQIAVWVAILTGAAAAYQTRLMVIASVEQKYYKDLYYQMSWRIPALERQTAFFIDYNPEQNPMAINYALGLIVNGMYDVNPDNKNQYYWMLLDNLSPRPWTAFGKNVPINENHFDYTNFHGNTSNTIALMQPAKGCLRVVDSSNRDLMDLSPYTAIASTISNTALIKNDTSKKINYDWLKLLYGKQSTKCWCYYFEKAELARQYGDWQKAYDLLQESLDKKLKPENDVEWVTYIEACLHTHHYDKAKEVLASKELVSKFSKSYVYDVLTKWKQKAPASEAAQMDEMIQLSLVKAGGESHNR